MLPSQTLFTATQIAYAIICETKLWLFTRGVSMEHTSDLVKQGKAVHEQRYPRERKDVLIDSKLGIDFIRKGERIVLHEVKKSEKLEKAHVMQLLYYLKALRDKGVDAEGVIDYPLTRRRKEVLLTPEAEQELVKAETKLKDILQLPKPPEPQKS